MVGFLITIGVIAALAGLVGWHGRPKTSDDVFPGAAAVWQEAAAALGGEISDLHSEGLLLVASVAGSPVTARTHITETRILIYTEIITGDPWLGPRFLVTRVGSEFHHPHVPWWLPSWDPQPDDAVPGFLVSGDDRRAAIAWVAAILGKLPAPYSFDCGVLGGVRGFRGGAEYDGQRLAAAVRAVALLRHGPDHLVRAFAELAAELDGRATASPDPWYQMSFEGFHAGVAFTLEVFAGSSSDTRVSVDHGLGETPVPAPEWDRSVVALRPRAVVLEERRAAIVLPGVVLDAARIRAVVEYLGSLGMRGPYR